MMQQTHEQRDMSGAHERGEGEACEVCGQRPATRTYESVFDGDAENGPCEPVETHLRLCDDERCGATVKFGVGALNCDTCGTRQLVVQTGTIEEHRDPTTYKLACGHWTI